MILLEDTAVSSYLPHARLAGKAANADSARISLTRIVQK